MKRTAVRKKGTPRRTRRRFESLPIPYESGTRHENGETPLVSNETFEVHADIPDENVGKASAEDENISSGNGEEHIAFFEAGKVTREEETIGSEESSAESCDDHDGEEAAEDDRGLVDKLLTWPVFSAIILLSGTLRMKRKDYEGMREMSNFKRDISDQAPSDSYMRKVILPFILKTCFPQSMDTTCEIDVTKSGSRLGKMSPGLSSSRRAHCTTSVRVVLPSTWAERDIQTGPILDCIKSSKRDSSDEREDEAYQIASESIENSFIVKCRSAVLNDPFHRISVSASDHDGHKMHRKVYARHGDELRIICMPTTNQEALVAKLGGARTKQGKNIETGKNSRSRRSFTARSDWRIEAIIIASYLATGEEQQESNMEDVIDPQIDAMEETEKINARRVVSTTTLDGEHCNNDIRAGDAITLFRPKSKSDGSTFEELLLVNRHLKKGRSEHATFLICSTRGATGQLHREQIRVKDVQLIGAPDKRSRWHPGSKRMDACSEGNLSDGRKYIVYRFLLYADDFQPFTSRKGSFGGCYMLPLGIQPSKRASFHAVRVLGFVPPGVSTNVVIERVVPDIVKGSTDGFPAKDANGEDVVIFLDPVGFIGDYPAVSHTLDVRGHTSNTPCHSCIFEKQDMSSSGGSRNAYTALLNSQMSTHARGMHRNKLVREVASQDQLKVLGLSLDPIENKALHNLSESLNRVRRGVPTNEEGVPVVPCQFDPYRSAVVAPDHLLSGLAQDVMNATITAATPVLRNVAETVLLNTLRMFCLSSQSQVFGQNYLLSMNMSDIFAVLVVAPQAFYSAFRIVIGNSWDGYEKLERILRLLKKFQMVVASIRFIPTWWIDGLESTRRFEAENGGRHDHILALVSDYMKELHEVCKKDPIAMKHLDKPNLHRLIEFCVHTLPAFGAAKHVEELLFERMHQPLKRGVRNSNHKNEHLSSMELIMADDWLARIAITLGAVGHNTKQWTSADCRRVYFALGKGISESPHATEEAAKRCFLSPVFHLISERSSTMVSTHCPITRWRGESVEDAKNVPAEETVMMARIRKASETFLRTRQVNGSQHGERLWWLTAAQRVRTSHEGSESESRLGRAEPGSIIQAVCKDGWYDAGIVVPAHSRTSMEEFTCSRRVLFVTLSFFIVVGQGEEKKAKKWKQKTPYAVCIPLTCTGDGMYRKGGNDTIVHVEMNDGVREVLHVHNCESGVCSYDRQSGIVEHNSDILSGGEVSVLTREDGYPPRSA